MYIEPIYGQSYHETTFLSLLKTYLSSACGNMTMNEIYTWITRKKGINLMLRRKVRTLTFLWKQRKNLKYIEYIEFTLTFRNIRHKTGRCNEE
jgi:hypothetical protein